jgi:hypothetical protein
MDQVGAAPSVIALANGSYVVGSPRWDDGSTRNAGAVTFCDGTSGCTGAVSPANSLVGSSAEDRVGVAVLALTDGGYVSMSPGWDGGVVDRGAVTWCSATTGCTGTISDSNSLVGSTAHDAIGGRAAALPDGDYAVGSRGWDDVGVVDAGAVTWGRSGGFTVGPITAENSVRGTLTSSFPWEPQTQPFVYDSVRGRLIVGRPLENIVTLFAPEPGPTGAVLAVVGALSALRRRAAPAQPTI